MQASDAKSWFIHQVVATYDLYVCERDRATTGRQQHQRAALDCAAKLYHFREHLPRDIQCTRKEVEEKCPDFKLVADVSNASKHHEPTHGKPLVRSILDVEERAVVTEFVGTENPYTHAYTCIVVTMSSGERVLLDPALSKVLNFWSDFLRQFEIAEYPARPIPDYEPKAIDRSKAKTLKLEVMRGIDWKPTIELRRFNLQNNIPEDCDLRDADIQLRIYRP